MKNVVGASWRLRRFDVRKGFAFPKVVTLFSIPPRLRLGELSKAQPFRTSERHSRQDDRSFRSAMFNLRR
jgi:hypothetical protein